MPLLSKKMLQNYNYRQNVQKALVTKAPKDHWCESFIRCMKTNMLCFPFTTENCWGAKCFIILKRKKNNGHVGAVGRELAVGSVTATVGMKVGSRHLWGCSRAHGPAHEGFEEEPANKDPAEYSADPSEEELARSPYLETLPVHSSGSIKFAY